MQKERTPFYEPLTPSLSPSDGEREKAIQPLVRVLNARVRRSQRERRYLYEYLTVIWIVLSIALASRAAEPLHFAGQPAELAIEEVSERMVRIELSPLDEKGHPRS